MIQTVRLLIFFNPIQLFLKLYGDHAIQIFGMHITCPPTYVRTEIVLSKDQSTYFFVYERTYICTNDVYKNHSNVFCIVFFNAPVPYRTVPYPVLEYLIEPGTNITNIKYYDHRIYAFAVKSYWMHIPADCNIGSKCAWMRIFIFHVCR